MGRRPASDYRELAPPPALARYVECLWMQCIGHGEGLYDQPVLPDGCMDVVAGDGQVHLAGPATRTTTVRSAPDTLTVGVRFRPGAAPALIGASAADLRDQDVPLDAVWSRAGTSLAAHATETPRGQDRLRVLVDGLLGRLGEAQAPDPVGVGIGTLLAARPGRPVSVLADEVGLSERHLRRRVEEAVGYSPRMLARILRFQRFLRAARAAGPGRHLAGLAVDAGYADQAHLTRESRDLGGRPPAALLDWEAERLAG